MRCEHFYEIHLNFFHSCFHVFNAHWLWIFAIGVRDSQPVCLRHFIDSILRISLSLDFRGYNNNEQQQKTKAKRNETFYFGGIVSNQTTKHTCSAWILSHHFSVCNVQNCFIKFLTIYVDCFVCKRNRGKKMLPNLWRVLNIVKLNK